MAKVTSKLQVTLPKVIAERYKIHPGDEIEWVPAGNAIHVVPPSGRKSRLDLQTRLRLFDEATKRHGRRTRGRRKRQEPSNRGWIREELYDRKPPRRD